ncbi:MAG: hypothetical protein K8S27_00215 [Candidatus Omnitrophica bacterium]|nr:hypothetical protein [Candidatus Omnitrophota bacterium]
MRRLIFFLCFWSVIVLIPPPVCTQTALNYQNLIQNIQNQNIDPRKLQIIYFLLKNTPEHYIHNMNGATGNSVYVHENGLMEIVYDKEGNLVQDGINDGSYNYYSRIEQPLKHYFYDMHPWIIMGGSERDTTTKGERIFAYISDLEGAIWTVLKQKDQIPRVPLQEWDDKGQLQTLALFLFVQKHYAKNSLFDLFDKDPKDVAPEDVVHVLKKIDIGLNDMYEALD